LERPGLAGLAGPPSATLVGEAGAPGQDVITLGRRLQAMQRRIEMGERQRLLAQARLDLGARQPPGEKGVEQTVLT